MCKRESRVLLTIGLTFLALTATGQAVAAGDTGIVGIGHPGMSFGQLATAHDPTTGPLIGVDIFANAGAAFKTAAVTAEPDGQFTKLGFDGLPLVTFSNDNDPAGTFGIQDFKAANKFTANGVNTIRSKLMLEQGGIDTSKSIGAGAGMFAQYRVAGSQEMIDLQFNLAITGDVTIPDTRTNAVYSIGTDFIITAMDGTPMNIQTGVWQGGFDSDFTAGLLGDPGVTTSFTDAGNARTRSIAGSTSWTVSVPNESVFNLNYTAFYNLAGPSGEAPDNIYIDLGDTIELTFGLAPGFENAQLILIPEPTSLVGDLNGDGFVGAGDLDILLGVWNQNVGDGVAADLNEDGFIGAGDLDILLGNWNAGTPPTGSADVVPEPASLALLALGGLAMLRRRR